MSNSLEKNDTSLFHQLVEELEHYMVNLAMPEDEATHSHVTALQQWVKESKNKENLHPLQAGDSEKLIRIRTSLGDAQKEGKSQPDVQALSGHIDKILDYKI